jgi:hypothetical protein
MSKADASKPLSVRVSTSEKYWRLSAEYRLEPGCMIPN